MTRRAEIGNFEQPEDCAHRVAVPKNPAISKRHCLLEAYQVKTSGYCYDELHAKGHSFPPKEPDLRAQLHRHGGGTAAHPDRLRPVSERRSERRHGGSSRGSHRRARDHGGSFEFPASHRSQRRRGLQFAATRWSSFRVFQWLPRVHHPSRNGDRTRHVGPASRGLCPRQGGSRCGGSRHPNLGARLTARRHHCLLSSARRPEVGGLSAGQP